MADQIEMNEEPVLLTEPDEVLPMEDEPQILTVPNEEDDAL